MRDTTLLKASVSIPLPGAAEHLNTILASLRIHDVKLTVDEMGYLIETPFGRGHIGCTEETLEVCIQAQGAGAFNRIKADLTGIIDFAVPGDDLQIQWQGDKAGTVTPPDLRILTVVATQHLTPRMRRITFSGDHLERFAVSDQIHCRLLFQPKGVEHPQWPELDDQGKVIWPTPVKLPSRIYTIRAIDLSSNTLTIDFVLHDGVSGLGNQWAKHAESGDVVGIIGPNAHGPKQAELYLLAGDETGLPGIARILETLPKNARGVALIEIDNPDEKQALQGPEGIAIRWLSRDGQRAGSTHQLIDAVRQITIPSPDEQIFCWVGAEYSAFRDVQHYLRQALHISVERIVAFSHWRAGMSETDIIKAGPGAITP